jgi:hypothetical protein
MSPLRTAVMHRHQGRFQCVFCHSCVDDSGQATHDFDRVLSRLEHKHKVSP